MYYLTATQWENPTLFGLFFLMDTQATGAAIIMGNMEAQKRTKDSLKGFVGSIGTAAFGFGATVWTGLYDGVFKPNLEQHFMCSSVLSGILVFFLFVFFVVYCTVTLCVSMMIRWLLVV